MNERDWGVEFARTLGVRLVFDDPVAADPDDTLETNTLMMLFHADGSPLRFKLPALAPDERWELLIDTYDDPPAGRLYRGGHRFELREHSVAVLRKAGTPKEAR
jgi:glycogen operon protein